MTETTERDLTGLSPSEVDTLWAETALPAQRAEMRLKDALKRQRRYRGSGARVPDYLTETETEARAELQEALKALEPFSAEWNWRGGWARYFLVPGGHIHFHTCSTLTPTKTWLGMVPEASGLTPAEVVERFSYTACTHCFPGAPVEPKLTPEEEGFCAQSGKPLTDAQREKLDRKWGGPYRWLNAAVAPSVRCECGGYPSVTKSGKIRKHKPGRPQL